MTMSLRKIAKELGVSHTLLSLWRQGKRKLAPEVEKRYWRLMNGSVTTNGENGYTGGSSSRKRGKTTAWKAGTLPLSYSRSVKG